MSWLHTYDPESDKLDMNKAKAGETGNHERQTENIPLLLE